MSLLFSLGHPWPICLPWASSVLLLTLYSHELLLTSLGFPGPITHTHLWGLWACHQFPILFACIALGLPWSILTFVHIIHCPWVCYSLLLSFRALLSPFAFVRPIYLFHGPVIHYSCRLDLIVFVLCLLSTSLCCWVRLPFLHLGFTKKDPQQVLRS